MDKISAVIITKNEEENITDCIKTLSFCSEIILVDESQDKTPEIAKKLGAKVYRREMKNDFSAQRNFGLEKAQGPWVLFIDADERISGDLRREILSEISKKTNYTSGYLFKRIDYIWGQEIRHGEVGKIRLLRLARKGSGKWKRIVHEHWHVIGETKTFRNPLEHYPHPTVSEFLDEVNVRSTLHSLANTRERKKPSVLKVIFYPLLKFIDNFVVKMGLLDGTAGFVIAMMMSFHSFLSWAKLWLGERK